MGRKFLWINRVQKTYEISGGEKRRVIFQISEDDSDSSRHAAGLLKENAFVTAATSKAPISRFVNTLMPTLPSPAHSALSSPTPASSKCLRDGPLRIPSYAAGAIEGSTNNEASLLTSARHLSISPASHSLSLSQNLVHLLPLRIFGGPSYPVRWSPPIVNIHIIAAIVKVALLTRSSPQRPRHCGGSALSRRAEPQHAGFFFVYISVLGPFSALRGPFSRNENPDLLCRVLLYPLCILCEIKGVRGIVMTYCSLSPPPFGPVYRRRG